MKTLRLKSRLESSDLMTPVLALAVLLGLALASLSWLGYRASEEWQKSARLVEERHADEVTTLLTTALARDMRGVGESVLVPFQREQLAQPYEVSEIVARAFAQFPYPESFFVSTVAEHDRDGSAFLYNRTDRPPKWEDVEKASGRFPVTTIENSPVALTLASLARRNVLPEAQVAVFETTLTNAPYQVITRLFYGPAKQVVGVIGFTVNLEWVRNGYFPELTGQIERIGGQSDNAAFSLSILDEKGKVVTETRPASGAGPLRERQFELAFFNLSAVSAGTLSRLPLRRWTARIRSADDTLLGAADAGARRTLILIFVATGVAIASLISSIIALRTKLELAAMKSDFIDTVSHELKTPLTGISLVGEMLCSRRDIPRENLGEYGSVLLTEATRLGRLLENLLTLSRVTHSKNPYIMAPASIHDVLSEALKRLDLQIHTRGFHVTCSKPDERVKVYCDRQALVHVFENLIENAIKYSDDVKEIELSVSVTPRWVNVTVCDKGKGILPEDLTHVFERFFRGRNADFGGSGLGLAIARDIVEAHGGRISLESAPGIGTSVMVTLPTLAEGAA